MMGAPAHEEGKTGEILDEATIEQELAPSSLADDVRYSTKQAESAEKLMRGQSRLLRLQRHERKKIHEDSMKIHEVVRNDLMA